MRSAAAALVLTLLGLAGGSAVQAPSAYPDAPAPAAGRYLVATQQIGGTIFYESVVFLLTYGGAGSTGVIVNRPTEIPLAQVMDGVAEGAGMIYLGGPVEPGSLMVLLRGSTSLDHAARIADDVFLTVDPALLKEWGARPDARSRLRAFAGYAGWGAGQLEGEIARGDWIVAEEPSAAIFDDDSGGELWRRLFRRHHRLLARAGEVFARGTGPRPRSGSAATLPSGTGRSSPPPAR